MKPRRRRQLRQARTRFQLQAATRSCGGIQARCLSTRKRPLACGVKNLIVKDVPRNVVADGRGRYDCWRLARIDARDSGSTPSMVVETAREWAAALLSDPALAQHAGVVHMRGRYGCRFAGERRTDCTSASRRSAARRGPLRRSGSRGPGARALRRAGCHPERDRGGGSERARPEPRRTRARPLPEPAACFQLNC